MFFLLAEKICAKHSEAIININWIAMHTFEIKTHRPGTAYSNPHFFILNKGLNSGKPLTKPCPNCFVVIHKSKKIVNQLFHLSMMLQIGGYFKIFLRGSVIPFITINDCKKVIQQNNKDLSKLEKSIQKLMIIEKQIKKYHKILDAIQQLKITFIRASLKR